MRGSGIPDQVRDDESEEATGH